MREAHGRRACADRAISEPLVARPAPPFAGAERLVERRVDAASAVLLVAPPVTELVQQHALEVDLVERGIVRSGGPGLARAQGEIALDDLAVLHEVGLDAERPRRHVVREAGDVEAILHPRLRARPALDLQAPARRGGLDHDLEALAADR